MDMNNAHVDPIFREILDRYDFTKIIERAAAVKPFIGPFYEAEDGCEYCGLRPAVAQIVDGIDGVERLGCAECLDTCVVVEQPKVPGIKLLNDAVAAWAALEHRRAA
jgi:hypothetical protein